MWVETRRRFTNLYESLAESARRFPDKIAAVDDECEISYSGLLARVDALAAFLLEEPGMRPLQAVAILQMNSIDFCASFYAVQKIGCTALVVNSKLHPAEIERLLGVAEPKTMLLDPSLWGKLAPVVKRTSLRHIVFRRAKSGEETAPSELPDSLKLWFMPEIYARPYRDAPCHEGKDAPSVLLFTSGSTGEPKGVVLTHTNLLASVRSYAGTLCLGEDEITVLAVPAFHVTGLICVMALFVYIGGRTVYIPKFDAGDALMNMAKYRATHFHAVSTVYILLLAALKKSGAAFNLDSMRACLCGGGAVGESTISEIKSFMPHMDFHPAYGLTETAGAGVLFPCDYFSKEKSGSAGKIVPGCTITVRGSGGEELPPGETGEICIRGYMVTPGYLGQGSLPNAELRTGDIGRVDTDGFVYIMDRIKDLVNRGGEKIYCLEVESLLAGMPGIRQVALFGMPDELYGEVPVAAVVPDQDAQLDEESVRRYAARRLARFKCPARVYFMDKLPVSANGKVQKYRLREIFKQPR